MNKDYYIVTGANGSIGQAITEALAAQNLPVVMGCRNIAKSQPIRQRIIEKTGIPIFSSCRSTLPHSNPYPIFVNNWQKRASP